MAVQHRTRGVGHRIGDMVVALDEHGVDGGDRALIVMAVAGAFDIGGERAKHRGRVALGGRRLADGEADLSQRHGDAGQAVDHEQDMMPLTAPILGDGGGAIGPVQTAEGGIVGGRRHHGAARAGRADMILDEFTDFTAALADHADDHDIRPGMLRHHSQQCRFADTAAGKEADPHAAAHGGEGIDSRHADIEGRDDAGTAHRVDRHPEERPGMDHVGHRTAIERHAPRIDDAAEQGVADERGGRPALHMHAGAAHHAARALLRHDQQ
jgi:hypothetical protein